MICRVRGEDYAGASRDVNTGASYITHCHLNHCLPATSYVPTMTLGRTASPAGDLRTPLQLLTYVPTFYLKKKTKAVTRTSNGSSRG